MPWVQAPLLFERLEDGDVVIRWISPDILSKGGFPQIPQPSPQLFGLDLGHSTYPETRRYTGPWILTTPLVEKVGPSEKRL